MQVCAWWRMGMHMCTSQHLLVHLSSLPKLGSESCTVQPCILRSSVPQLDHQPLLRLPSRHVAVPACCAARCSLGLQQLPRRRFCGCESEQKISRHIVNFSTGEAACRLQVHLNRDSVSNELLPTVHFPALALLPAPLPLPPLPWPSQILHTTAQWAQNHSQLFQCRGVPDR